MWQEHSHPWPPRVAGRRMPAAPPSQCRAPSRIPGRGPAGARAGPTRRAARAARKSTVSTSARGQTRRRSWT
eukprot:12196045-Alexandrium_andersonii.AAC.1